MKLLENLNVFKTKISGLDLRPLTKLIKLSCMRDQEFDLNGTVIINYPQ